jgi:hypothetical protein
VAFDSLRSRPLAGAFVTLDDGGRSTTTDESGRFVFEAVPLGVHSVAVQHAALDSAGLTGVATRFALGAPAAEVRVATPSFATLWRGFCGATPAPRDSGFVFGTVADARTGVRLAGASIDLSWLQLNAGDRRGKLRVTQVPWRGVARTSPDGAYAVCGTPTGVSLRLRALTDSTASDLIDLLPGGELRVRRLDLLLGPANDTTGLARGTVVGSVTNADGAAIPDVRVVMDHVPESRTDSAGHFVVRNVPVGTRQLEILAVGMMPVVTTVDVSARDTAAVAERLRRITTLDVVRVTASRRVQQLVADIEEQKRAGLGYIRDSAYVAPHGTMSSVFAEFPGAQMEPARGTSTAAFTVTMKRSIGPGRCVAPVWIDGVKATYDFLSFLRPDEIGIVEVYPRSFDVPMRYTANGDRNCGAVAVWTKWALK